jgi:hypothetical protein
MVSIFGQQVPYIFSLLWAMAILGSKSPPLLLSLID